MRLDIKFFFIRQEAQNQATAVLASPRLRICDIRRLKSDLEKGRLEGDCHATCFFGILGGRNYNGYNRIRRAVNITGDPRINPIENYCFGIHRGDIPTKNIRCRTLLQWVHAELHRREILSRREAMRWPNINIAHARGTSTEKVLMHA